MHEYSAERDFQKLVSSYNLAVTKGGAEDIARSLAQRIPDSVLGNSELHSELRHLRGNTFCRIGENNAAELEYGLGFYEAPLERKGDYLLDWAMSGLRAAV